MKLAFEKQYKKQKIPEWELGYFDYFFFKLTLEPYRKMNQCNMRGKESDFKPQNLSPLKKSFAMQRQSIIKSTMQQEKMLNLNMVSLNAETAQILEQLNEAFQHSFHQQIKKMCIFIEQESYEYVRTWLNIKINLSITKALQEQKDKLTYMKQIRKALTKFYKKLHLLINFESMNIMAMKNILKWHKKCHYKLNIQFLLADESKRVLLKEELQKNEFRANQKSIKNLKNEVEDTYLANFFPHKREEGLKKLKLEIKSEYISMIELFWFGTFFGCCIILLFVIIAIAMTAELGLDTPKMSKIFPIFRGVLCPFLYLWLLGMNVYGWKHANVNYKQIFKFKSHHSKLSQIYKRASIFSLVWLIMFLWYMILSSDNPVVFSVGIDFIPAKYTPFIIYCLFLGYFFFPSLKYMNGQGRMYVLNNWKHILFWFIYPAEFVTLWMKWSSFVIPMKDFYYACCFYTQHWAASSHEKANEDYCNSKVHIDMQLIIPSIPNIFCCIQTLKLMFQNKKLNKPFKDDFLNFLRFFSAIVVIFFSYLFYYSDNSGDSQTKFHANDPLFICWVISAIVSTLYSAYYDVKKDWGLFQPHAKHRYLRDDLAYKHIWFYYFAIGSNFLLRCSWVFTVSPGIAKYTSFIPSQYFILVISFLELYRRCQWNIFRVEREHINNYKLFRAVNTIVLPFAHINVEDNPDSIKSQGENIRQSLDSIPEIDNKLKLQRQATTNIAMIKQYATSAFDINKTKRRQDQIAQFFQGYLSDQDQEISKEIIEKRKQKRNKTMTNIHILQKTQSMIYDQKKQKEKDIQLNQQLNSQNNQFKNELIINETHSQIQAPNIIVETISNENQQRKHSDDDDYKLMLSDNENNNTKLKSSFNNSDNKHSLQINKEAAYKKLRKAQMSHIVRFGFLDLQEIEDEIRLDPGIVEQKQKDFLQIKEECEQGIQEMKILLIKVDAIINTNLNNTTKTIDHPKITIFGEGKYGNSRKIQNKNKRKYVMLREEDNVNFNNEQESVSVNKGLLQNQCQPEEDQGKNKKFIQ